MYTFIYIFNKIRWPFIARIIKRDIITSKYYNKIESAPHAGSLCYDIQIMHNGLLIYKKSYCDGNYNKILTKTRGIFEPEVQYYFENTLSKLKENPVMIELGSYWAFYSMWFLKDVNNGKVFLVDPSPKNLMHGMKNFSLNNLKGDFTCAFIAEKSYSKMNQIPTISLDSFANEKDIQDISVLHVDIQGYELEMMKGAQKLFQDKKFNTYF